MRQGAPADISELPHHSRLGLIAASLTVVVILGLGVAAFVYRDRVAALFNAVRPSPTQPAQKDPTKKFEDRVGQPDTKTQPDPNPQAAQKGAPAAAVNVPVLGHVWTKD